MPSQKTILPLFLEKRLHNGAKTAPLLEKWHHFQPFSGKANGTSLVRGTVFFLSNMIIKEKNGSTLQKRDHFLKQFPSGAILTPLFSV